MSSRATWAELFHECAKVGEREVFTLHGPATLTDYEPRPARSLDGSEIRAWRMRLGLTMGDVADHFGVPVAYVSGAESGRGPYHLKSTHADVYAAELLAAEKRGVS